MQTNKLQTAITALALMLLLTSGAMAQIAGAGGDILGAAPIKDAAVVVFKIIAALGIFWGFVRLMSGRHTMEGLAVMAVGALGVAKGDAIATFMGL